MSRSSAPAPATFGCVSFIFGLILSAVIVASIFPFYMAIDTYYTREALLERGLTVRGTVIDRQIVTPFDGADPKYTVSYRYIVNDREYVRDEDVEAHVYRSLSRGDTVTVLYVSDEPKRATIGDPPSEDIVLGFVVIGLALVLVPMFIMRAIRRALRKSAASAGQQPAMTLGKVVNTRHLQPASLNAEVRHLKPGSIYKRDRPMSFPEITEIEPPTDLL